MKYIKVDTVNELLKALYQVKDITIDTDETSMALPIIQAQILMCENLLEFAIED